MIKTAVPLLFLILFAGCGASATKTREEAQKNRNAILSLEIGMTEDEVLATMGKPRKIEIQSSNNRNIELWLYLTEGLIINDGIVRHSDHTPLAFENGKLIGWGRNFYDRILFYRNKN